METIWKKIINWFKNFFGKQESQKLLEEQAPEEIVEDDVVENFGEVNKEEFFEAYTNIKSQNTGLEDLSTEELIEFNMMAEKEIEMKKQKIKDQKIENEMMKQEIENLKQEEVRLQNRVDSSQS